MNIILWLCCYGVFSGVSAGVAAFFRLPAMLLIPIILGLCGWYHYTVTHNVYPMADENRPLVEKAQSDCDLRALRIPGGSEQRKGLIACASFAVAVLVPDADKGPWYNAYVQCVLSTADVDHRKVARCREWAMRD